MFPSPLYIIIILILLQRIVFEGAQTNMIFSLDPNLVKVFEFSQVGECVYLEYVRTRLAGINGFVKLQ